MKIKSEHYNTMRDAIAQIPLPMIEEYCKRTQVAKDSMKLRWMLMHNVMPAAWICDNIYPYANDTHIDTALRAIVRELGI